MKQRISKSEKFPIYNYTTRIKNQIVSRDIVERPNVAAIIAVKDNKILTVRINRFPNGVDIEIPSGNIEKGEKTLLFAIYNNQNQRRYLGVKLK